MQGSGPGLLLANDLWIDHDRVGEERAHSMLRVDEPLRRVLDELDEVAAIATDAREPLVVPRACEVVVIREQMRRREWHSVGEENLELEEAAGPAVAVPEGVDQLEVEVGADRLEDHIRKVDVRLIFGGSELIPEPVEHPAHEVVEVLRGRASVRSGDDRVHPKLTRNDLWRELKALKNHPVPLADRLESWIAWPVDFEIVGDRVERPDHVLDLHLEVLLGPWKVEVPRLDDRSDLLLRKSVAFDRGGRPCTLREVDTMELLGDCRSQRHAADVLDFASRLPEQHP